MRSIHFLSTLLVVLVVFASVPGGAQPKLQVNEGSDINIDTTAPGILLHPITLQNIGNKPLYISGIRTSCGCTTVPLNRNIIDPGDTEKLTIRMDFHDKKGEQHKEIYIVSDDPVDSMHEVRLRAFLARDLESYPLSFPAKTNQKVGAEFETEVALKNTGKDTLVLHTPQINSSAMSARFSVSEGTKLAPNESLPLKAYITLTKPGYSTGKVVVASSSRHSPTITVDIIAMAQDPKVAAQPVTATH